MKRKRVHPSKDTQPPKSFDFDWSVPRCESCRFRQAPRTVIADTRKPVLIIHPVCLKADEPFFTRDVSVCKHWTNAQGEKLNETHHWPSGR